MSCGSAKGKVHGYGQSILQYLYYECFSVEAEPSNKEAHKIYVFSSASLMEKFHMLNCGLIEEILLLPKYATPTYKKLIKIQILLRASREGY